ncbi:hypothetical protein ACFVTY_01865 [Streptomyces sp. NPDC058067]|uniref:hypothetical protein n=1 Tax=Streptomyces sp. NPDC058067 TaxID=3346324 RepID=UPI0036E3E3A2
MTARQELFRRVAGAFIDEGKANELLDAYRDEVLREAADFLKEIGTPIHGERSEHERGVMYASERLRVFAEGGAS